STTEITTFPLNSPSLLADFQEATQYKAVVDQAATQFNLPKGMIGGLASRESRWGLALTPRGPGGTGDRVPRAPNPSLRAGPLPSDGGFGRGLMQIDYDAFPFARTGSWQDPRENILFGCKVLSDYRQLIQSKTHLEGRSLLKAAVAAYNCGPGRVLTALQKQIDVDFFTAGRNYSKDVLNRTGWFQLQGWV
ncbi:MAG TPA: transglycosylase SLT domain-containing protein, partial [Terriglobia bacterium]|nr:transglycosylase SLT domain-containing protein [Terriglobia bacterium]